MNRLDLENYSEPKPHRVKRIVWRVCDMVVFPLLPMWGRRMILRAFGAKIGRGFNVYRTTRIFAPWNLVAGNFCCIGPRAEIYNKDRIELGDSVVISQDAYLCTASHDISSPVMALVTKPITIGDNCWVAAKAAVLPGVTLGEGAVVGACAVVAKDVPAWSVVVGNPAQVVGERRLEG